MAYKIAVRLNMFPCIKAGQGDLTWGAGSQKPAKDSERASLSTISSPIRRLSHTTVTLYL